MWISEYMLESGGKQAMPKPVTIDREDTESHWICMVKCPEKEKEVKVYCLIWWKGIWDCDIGHHVMPSRGVALASRKCCSFPQN